jgi:hypothetical protein
VLAGVKAHLGGFAVAGGAVHRHPVGAGERQLVPREHCTPAVARGDLSLSKLRDRIEGRRSRATAAAATGADGEERSEATAEEAEAAWTGRRRPAEPLQDDSLVNAKQLLSEARGAVDVLRSPDAVASIGAVDRANLAKYLTIAKLKLENAIAMVRSAEPL